MFRSRRDSLERGVTPREDLYDEDPYYDDGAKGRTTMTVRVAMENAKARLHFVRTTGVVALLALLLCATAWAQQITVSGRVTSTDGSPLTGVVVNVQGAAARTTTDANGTYSISAPADAILTFALIGYRGMSVGVGGRTSIDVTMTPAIAVLQEVVVTGYTTERRADITGAVASVNTQDVGRQTEANVLKTLAGATTGVTVDASGSPGSRSTVRIRGISSFQNNDPLYIIDGTPIQTSDLNWLNPDDIASIQVLKDASAASIYGSRASNGVIIIETHKRGGGVGGGGPRATLDVRTGIASPTKGYSNILMTHTLDYFEFLKRSYLNAGLHVPTNIYGNDTLGNNPSVPKYIWPNNCSPNPCTNVDTSTYSYPYSLIIPGSPGTDWWAAVFRPAIVGDYNLSVAGGSEASQYNISFNYLNQQGTAKYNRFQRGGLRSNTAFTRGRVSFGENIAISRQQSYGGINDNQLGEDNIIGKNIFEQPVVPIYDIRGNFGGGRASGLSNLTNPLQYAYESQHNITTNDRIFGNVFGEVNVASPLSLKTALGFNLGQQSYRGYSFITPQNAEANYTNGINENYSLGTDWTWTNTMTYKGAWGQHTLNLLLGQEANQSVSRYESGSCSSLLNDAVDSRYIQDALCDPTTKNVTSSGSKAALLSFFGKADYNFADRYYLSVTVRRDGSSRLGPANKWGTFPAFGLGWQLTNGPFAPGRVVSSMRLRFGWGITGNQQIPSGRVVSQFGGDRGDTFYDIAGSLTTIVPGYKVTAIGNSDLKWEEDKSANIGLDMGLWQGKGTITVDVYQRNSNNLLFDPRTPATAGTADPPIINIGKMTNRGIEFSLGLRGGARTQWSVTFNGSHYKNKIVEIDAQGDSSFFGPYSLREQNPVINKVGYPIGSFYGLVADGYYADSADAAPYWDSGARPGRIKFKDLNGDGIISNADRAVIGSPNPNFTAGLDLSLRRGAWDISATLFGSFGNKIFNAQKYWDVFGYFDTNVRKDRLTESVVLDGVCAGSTCPGKVTNPDAKYPRLDNSDVFSRQFSSYWVESGTYVRVRTLQIGYDLPSSALPWLQIARVYVQAENLFTLTGYSGLDPALPAWAATGAATFATSSGALMKGRIPAAGRSASASAPASSDRLL
jgi:TonB-linked SusC/RagA family outer membrane protein